jgi:NADPH:quinone reductase-like Zn-dependent oxidoreductase
LYKLATELKANVGLDAVAGDMPGRILQCLGRGGVLINYGLLSGEKIGPINPIVFIFKGQKIEAFLLPIWIQTKSLWTAYNSLKASKPLIQGVIVQKKFGLHQITEAIEFYKANMTGGKIFLDPSILPEENKN